MHVALQIFSTTLIHVHPFSPTSIHFHPLPFTFIYFRPLSNTSFFLGHLLSDPGKPGVRSLGRDVSPSETLLKLTDNAIGAIKAMWQCMWPNYGTNASGDTWWSLGGQIWNEFKWRHLVEKFATNANGSNKCNLVVKFATNTSDAIDRFFKKDQKGIWNQKQSFLQSDKMFAHRPTDFESP